MFSFLIPTGSKAPVAIGKTAKAGAGTDGETEEVGKMPGRVIIVKTAKPGVTTPAQLPIAYSVCSKAQA